MDSACGPVWGSLELPTAALVHPCLFLVTNAEHAVINATTRFGFLAHLGDVHRHSMTILSIQASFSATCEGAELAGINLTKGRR